MYKPGTCRLLRRFFAASRQKLREVVGRLDQRSAANLVEVRPDDAILNYGSHGARSHPSPRVDRGQILSTAQLFHSSTLSEARGRAGLFVHEETQRGLGPQTSTKSEIRNEASGFPIQDAASKILLEKQDSADL
jgi:hypothetical protein